MIVGTILSAVLSVWAENRRSKDQTERDRQQREHELALRQLELREEHRRRLHADRRAAYAEYLRAYRKHDAATRLLRKAVDDLNEEETDSTRRFVIRMAEDLTDAESVLTEALSAVELVATSRVSEATEHLQVALRRHGGQPGEERRLRLTGAERELRTAIRDELELDR